MKIIKQGKKRRIPGGEYSCPHCATVFEPEKLDIAGATADPSGNLWLVCPNDGCGHYVQLNPWETPPCA